MSTLLLRGPDKSVDHLIQVLQDSKHQCSIIESSSCARSCSTAAQTASGFIGRSSTATTLIQAFQSWESEGSSLIKSNADSR